MDVDISILLWINGIDRCPINRRSIVRLPLRRTVDSRLPERADRMPSDIVPCTEWAARVRRLRGAPAVAARRVLQVPAGGADAGAAELAPRGQRAAGVAGRGGALPGLLARQRPPARRLPAGPLRAAPRRAAR